MISFQRSESIPAHEAVSDAVARSAWARIGICAATAALLQIDGTRITVALPVLARGLHVSGCGPCRSEFGLFAVPSAGYGRRVAFLGADTDDSAGDARTFLAAHPVSYPSYQTSTAT